MCPSVAHVMGFDGVRASVGYIVPGAAIQPSPESVHPGAATGTITKVAPFKFYNFDYLPNDS